MLLQASPELSPPATPRENSGQDSPTAFVVTTDADLANDNVTADDAEHPDEPSAADYNPTMDMEEDKLRQTQFSRKDEVSSGAYDQTVITDQDFMLPGASMDHPEPSQRALKKHKDEFDMFADEDDVDMFTEAPYALDADQAAKELSKAVAVPSIKALDMAMLDDWDDPDGYYKVILGELLDARYHVQSNLGKGMFSGVVRATDMVTKSLVAIKLIRNNETM